jgi:hypothetical protein
MFLQHLQIAIWSYDKQVHVALAYYDLRQSNESPVVEDIMLKIETNSNFQCAVILGSLRKN